MTHDHNLHCCPLHDSAPALLEALEQLVGSAHEDIEGIRVVRSKMEKARTAIKLARGGENG